MTEGRRRVRVLVHGRVQGVAFRAATADRARLREVYDRYHPRA